MVEIEGISSTKWSIFQEGNGIFGSVGGLEPSGGPWREKNIKQNVPTVAPIGRKKSASTFLLPKKKEHLGGARESPPRPPEGYQRLTLGQRSVNLGSTLGQPWVSSLAISGRFSLILPDSQIKT